MVEDWAEVGDTFRLRTDDLELKVTEQEGGLHLDIRSRDGTALQEPQVVPAPHDVSRVVVTVFVMPR